MPGKKTKPPKPASANELRRRAEAKLKSNPPVLDEVTSKDALKLIHDLQVHQIELEMQNEELRRAQATIEASRARYSDLYDFAPVGYLTLDVNGKVLEANLTVAGLLGVKRGLLLQKPFQLYIVEEDRDKFHLYLRTVLSTKESQICELRLKPQQGGNRHARLDTILAQDSNGRRSLRTSVTDISERKEMERQLVQSEKLASLGLLVSGVAHEINNPNSFISFNIPILRDYLQELMPILDCYALDHPDMELVCMNYQEFRQDLFKLLDNLQHGSDRIIRIVSNLKEYARKRESTELRWFELKEVMDKAINICHAEIRKKVKSFEVQIDEDAPSIFSDPEALEQIFVNLLINAVHASDKRDSWISLRVGCEKSREGCCRIEVSDNGCGMDEKVMDKIFDPFFTTKATSSGTGLGLYVCYTLVEALGGKIEVASTPGKGSTFRIVLPYTNHFKRKMDTVD
jgi:PAS domain S-box-containing protein